MKKVYLSSRYIELGKQRLYLCIVVKTYSTNVPMYQSKKKKLSLALRYTGIYVQYGYLCIHTGINVPVSRIHTGIYVRTGNYASFQDPANMFTGSYDLSEEEILENAKSYSFSNFHFWIFFPRCIT